MTTVLLVDDSPTEVYVFKSALEKNGYTVFIANDGDEGVVKAKEVKPDVIIMDVVMPGTNGFKATRQLNCDPQTSSIPVVMVTTKNQETDKIWGMRQGAVNYLVKPVTAGDLVKAINIAVA